MTNVVPHLSFDEGPDPLAASRLLAGPHAAGSNGDGSSSENTSWQPLHSTSEASHLTLRAYYSRAASARVSSRLSSIEQYVHRP